MLPTVWVLTISAPSYGIVPLFIQACQAEGYRLYSHERRVIRWQNKEYYWLTITKLFALD